MTWYYQHYLCNEIDKPLAQVKSPYLPDLPIVILTDDNKNVVEQLSSIADAQNSANEQLQEYDMKCVHRARTAFGLTKVTETLESFYKLDFKAFMAELKKQKNKLSLRDQDAWEAYCNSYRPDCTRLLLEIDENDRKIDPLVYALYELTDEGIGL